MNPESLKTIKKAAAGLEHSLAVFETYLEDENNSHLYQATLRMVEALRLLHDVDATLLCAENTARVEAILLKESEGRKGRSNFNTGF